MKLRQRLLLFSTAQLAVFGVVFALAYAAFEYTVVPVFEALLVEESEHVARLISSELDVPLGAEDTALVAATIQPLERDPDFAYVIVRNANDQVVYVRGVAPAMPLFENARYLGTKHPGGIAAWGPVSLEGMKLGSVAVVFSTARIDALQTWAARIGIGVLLLWIAALLYSVLFARAFVTPIRAMMNFSRKVAGGELSERLAIHATGELAELRDYLNEMTAELERREAERKTAAARAETLQRELLAVSRTAGMAEVATGVLHNVGNVLNSLNVSVSMIGDKVRNSRVAALSKSVDLYGSFPGGLAAFLETPKGKVLPDYLVSVSKRLAEENSTVLEELASVARNVDHIKTIVAMQQSHARATDVKEPVVLAELIDDALRMGESSFAKHRIEVLKEYDGTAPIETDRHKLLQIVINLISNARHALKDSGGENQKLVVRVQQTPSRAVIAIADTGVGIPRENLERIFEHGFTTKKDGHGFGLHSCANAARELGGSIHAASDGPGSGATFTLEIPISPTGDVHDETN